MPDAGVAVKRDRGVQVVDVVVVLVQERPVQVAVPGAEHSTDLAGAAVRILGAGNLGGSRGRDVGGERVSYEREESTWTKTCAHAEKFTSPGGGVSLSHTPGEGGGGHSRR